ncbi:hypothetical protein RS9916_34957 [Synechococcus sp. RS9916]|nr:hypothetical protein RS9916_34957 [Synechococcus sp. RS9916]
MTASDGGVEVEEEMGAMAILGPAVEWVVAPVPMQETIDSG